METGRDITKPKIDVPIDYLVKLFFISFIINILIVFYSLYSYLNFLFFKSLRYPFTNIPKN